MQTHKRGVEKGFQMSTDAAEGGSFLSQVAGKLGGLKDEAVETIKRESAEGGKLDVMKDKLGEFKDQAAGKLGEAVDAVKKEAADGGKIDAVKDKLTGAFEGVKDKFDGSQGAAQ